MDGSPPSEDDIIGEVASLLEYNGDKSDRLALLLFIEDQGLSVLTELFEGAWEGTMKINDWIGLQTLMEKLWGISLINV